MVPKPAQLQTSATTVETASSQNKSLASNKHSSMSSRKCLRKGNKNKEEKRRSLEEDEIDQRKPQVWKKQKLASPPMFASDYHNVCVSDSVLDSDYNPKEDNWDEEHWTTLGNIENSSREDTLGKTLTNNSPDDAVEEALTISSSGDTVKEAAVNISPKETVDEEAENSSVEDVADEAAVKSSVEDIVGEAAVKSSQDDLADEAVLISVHEDPADEALIISYHDDPADEALIISYHDDAPDEAQAKNLQDHTSVDNANSKEDYTSSMEAPANIDDAIETHANSCEENGTNVTPEKNQHDALMEETLRTPPENGEQRTAVINNPILQPSNSACPEFPFDAQMCKLDGHRAGIYRTEPSYKDYGEYNPKIMYADILPHFKSRERSWDTLAAWSRLAARTENELGGMARIASVQAAVRHKLAVRSKEDSCHVQLPHELLYKGTLANLCVDIGQNVPIIHSVDAIANSLVKTVRETYFKSEAFIEPWFVILQKSILREEKWKLQDTKAGFIKMARGIFEGVEIPEEILDSKLLLLYFCSLGRYPPSILRSKSNACLSNFIRRGHDALKTAIRELKKSPAAGMS
jgi:hypothetical protein